MAWKLSHLLETTHTRGFRFGGRVLIRVQGNWNHKAFCNWRIICCSKKCWVIRLQEKLKSLIVREVKAWATLLLFLLTWEKEIVLKDQDMSRTSLINPWMEMGILGPVVAWITIKESPSKTTLKKPLWEAWSTASLQAKPSKTKGSLMSIITLQCQNRTLPPKSLAMTTMSPLHLLKLVAASKLNLIAGSCGGTQRRELWRSAFVSWCGGEFSGEIAALNSSKWSKVADKILFLEWLVS